MANVKVALAALIVGVVLGGLLCKTNFQCSLLTTAPPGVEIMSPLQEAPRTEAKSTFLLTTAPPGVETMSPLQEVPRAEAKSTLALLPTADWKALTLQVGIDIAEMHAVAVNALDGNFHAHLPSYRMYTPYRGKVFVNEGLLVDFMGFVIMKDLYCNPSYGGQGNAHAIRIRQCQIYDQLSTVIPSYRALSKKLSKLDPAPVFQTQWPVVSEEYFEYADVLDAVSNYVQLRRERERKFVFVELGCGYGHWTFTAHKALMQKVPQASFKYLMVDVVSELLPSIQHVALLNGLNMTADQNSPLHFHAGHVGASGNADADKVFESNNHRGYVGGWGLKAVDKYLAARPISLASLLDIYAMPCEIDMLDVDIQTAEYHLFADPDTIDLVTSRVRRLHIGLHFGDEPSRVIEKAFHKRGWTTRWYFLATGETGKVPTPLGPVAFGDGILSLVNTRTNYC